MFGFSLSARALNGRTAQRLFLTALLLATTLLAINAPLRPTHAATFTVTSLNDSGAGSLRATIDLANAAPGADTIDFQAGLTGTIPLATSLPALSADVTIIGPGAATVTVSGQDILGVRPFAVNTGVTASIDGLTIADGNSAGNGGGILNNGTLTVTNSTISGNTAGDGNGGGIGNTGTVTVTNNTISGNTADFGGGIDNFGTGTVTNSTISGNTASSGGGGINNARTLTVTNSTISGNTAAFAGGGIGNANTLTVTNSTISGNTAAFGGGGIDNTDTGTLAITNSTISNNAADFGGGGILNSIFNIDKLTVTSTIVARNMAATNGPDILGAVTANDSLIGDTTDATITGTNNLLNADPLLGPLQTNGGPTFTMALLTDSPAIDAGSNSLGLVTDQRGPGFPRAVGAGPDIGAVEVQLSVTIEQAAAQADPTSTSPINFTVTFSETVTGFATGDVTLAGSAGATTGTVTGAGTTYNVAVTGMTGDGTVIASLAAAVADGNFASTSIDNSVTFTLPATPTPSPDPIPVPLDGDDDTNGTDPLDPSDPPPTTTIFTDGFESGALTSWTSTNPSGTTYQGDSSIDFTGLEQGLRVSGLADGPASIESATEGIEGDVFAIFAWDAATQAWLSFHVGAPSFLNTLTVLTPGQAVVVLTDDPDGVVWNMGSAIVEARDVELRAGFNFVGWTGPELAPIADVMAGLGDAVESLFMLNPQTGTFLSYFAAGPDFVNDLDAVPYSRAIWVMVTSDVTWTIPARDTGAIAAALR